MAHVLDERDWDGNGITITRNAYTFTITVELEPEGDTDPAYDEREVPLADFCKALGLRPVEEGRDV